MSNPTTNRSFPIRWERAKKKERDAGIIGFLTLLPTAVLFSMTRNGRLDPELEVDYLRRRDPDLPRDRAREITAARIRIFNSYRRTVRQELHGSSSTRIRTQD